MTEVPQVQSGLQHHLAGRVAEAEQVYRAVLQFDPHNPDALHLLGVLVAQRGEHEYGLQLLLRAVQLMPTVAEFHRHVGDAYALLNRNEEAFRSYITALQLNPQDHGAAYGGARAAATL